MSPSPLSAIITTFAKVDSKYRMLFRKPCKRLQTSIKKLTPIPPDPVPAQKRLRGASGRLLEGLEELWESSGRLWGAPGDLREALYIDELPINRPSGRYVI